MTETVLTLCDFTCLFPDEDVPRAWFERARWPDVTTSHHCGTIGDAAYIPKTKFWYCKACKGQFPVTAGTPMRRPHLPLLTWTQTIYLIVASSKGIGAIMAENSPLLSNVVEINEMYAGASRKRAKPERANDDRDQPPRPR